MLQKYSAQNISLTYRRDEHPVPEQFSMHTHQAVELYCFLEGKAVFHIEGTEYPMQPGDILLIRPNEAHYITVDAAIPYGRLHFIFSPELLNALDPEQTLMRPFFQRRAGRNNLYRADARYHSGTYINNILGAQNNHVTICANLALLLQELSDRFSRSPEENTEPDTVEYHILRYINKHLEDELTLEALCQRFYISRAQLCRRFKRATGTTPGQYIAVKRLIAARQQILQGEKPTEVYARFGYRDYSTFYRAYRRQFGFSPKDRFAAFGDLEADRVEFA